MKVAFFRVNVPRRDDDLKCRPFDLKVLDLDILLEHNPNGQVIINLCFPSLFLVFVAATNCPDSRRSGLLCPQHEQRRNQGDPVHFDFATFVGVYPCQPNSQNKSALTVSIDYYP